MDKKISQMLAPGSRIIEEDGTETGERGRVPVSQNRNVGEIAGAAKAEKEIVGASQLREVRGSDKSWHSCVCMVVCCVVPGGLRQGSVCGQQ
uniref:Uncharacterized protein n=1 Tax=Thermosporothrix sp. COM3 TaxID=2490863 RepID=A0A455SM13_9CHLR|nr:hypothetical protein KTC_19760 [Thermosporothrix sp. COM3]